MSYAVFVPAIIALVGGSALASVIWCFANRDMPSNRTRELYSRRRELLDKKRNAASPDSSEDMPASLHSEIGRAVSWLDRLDEMVQPSDGDIASEVETHRRFENWLVSRRKRTIERIRHLKLSQESDNPPHLHYVLSRAGEPTVNLGPLALLREFDVQYGDIDTKAEGFLRPIASAPLVSRSGLTGEFVWPGKSRKSRPRRVVKGKSA